MSIHDEIQWRLGIGPRNAQICTYAYSAPSVVTTEYYEVCRSAHRDNGFAEEFFAAIFSAVEAADDVLFSFSARYARRTHSRISFANLPRIGVRSTFIPNITPISICYLFQVFNHTICSLTD
jgi:hypothetical protein